MPKAHGHVGEGDGDAPSPTTKKDEEAVKMAELVKVAHTKKVNSKVFSAYGLIEIDQNGCADVPEEMAKKIEAGDYGEAWRLLKPVKKEVPKVEKKTPTVQPKKVVAAEAPPVRRTKKVRRKKVRKPKSVTDY